MHWLLVQVPATLAWKYGELNAGSPPYRTEPPPVQGWIGNIVNPMRLWDGLWYRLIAADGYDRAHPHKAAFWPLYPWGMRTGHEWFGITFETAGYLISNVAFVVALVLLYRLLILDFDRKVAAASLWALALFPTALFFSAVYTESLFLALLVGALLAARMQRWWLAGAIGAAAALTRSYGMFLVLPFAVLLWQQYGDTLRRQPARLLAVGIPLLGPAIFSWRLDRLQGNWRPGATCSRLGPGIAPGRGKRCAGHSRRESDGKRRKGYATAQIGPGYIGLSMTRVGIWSPATPGGSQLRTAIRSNSSARSRSLCWR